ncbi:phage holin family protein [Extensimonas sp. H3M7-6]|jgi:uncharacterized membrane protein YqjE|uniref:phage holin family protein n=1 Tax=Extensimonas soli TaxID=3031322 RepID=UPI0023DB17C0|nr:phage holin family protein [Extensimonas sp. H3M7-6]MDF1483295.1 phage holin family protein [Extensimonas sp. H3M7-6]
MNWLSLLGLDEWLARWHTSLREGAVAAEDRFELAHLEWQQLKRHGFTLLLLGAVLLVLTVVAFLSLSAAVLLQFWDSPQRALVAWLVALAWLLLWVGAAAWGWSLVQRCSNAFALTQRELAQDWRELKERL